MENCKHQWLVVTEINAAPWDDFMRHRGDDVLIPITFAMTHTIICADCREIKRL